MIHFYVPARPLPLRGLSLALAFFLAALAVPRFASSLEAPLPAVIERPIQALESHSFTFELAEGQFLGAVVEQDGIDLVVEVFDRQGNQLLEMDGPDYWMWEEEVALVAETSGSFRLTIRPYQPFAPAGKYRLRVDGPRDVKEADRARVEAVREMLAAHAANNPQARKARLEHLERALRLYTGLGERCRQAEVHHQLMDALGDLSRREEGQARFRDAMELWQELARTGGRIWTLLESWAVFPAERAQRNLDEALVLAEQSGNRFLEMRARMQLARFHRFQPRAAAGFLEGALRIAEELRHRDQELLLLSELAFAYDDLGEKHDALVLYEKALVLSKELGNVREEANALNNLGWQYAFLGKPEEAIAHYQQSVELSRRRGDLAMEAKGLNNQALIYEKLDPAKARELYGRSLALGRELGDLEIQSMAMNNLAFLDLRQGDPASALRRSQSALALAAGLPPVEVYVRLALGQAYRRLGDLEAARRELAAVLRLCRKHEDPVRESMALAALARTEIQGGDLPRARSLLEEGIRILESLRKEVTQPDLRASFLASRKDTYELYTDTLMALDRAQPGKGFAAEALRASEQTRARSLLDILTEAGASVRDEANPVLVEKGARLLGEIEDLERRRLELLGLDGSATEARAVGARLTEALAEHRKLEAELVASSPRFAALTHPEPLSVAEVQRDVLDGSATLLEYALGEERSFLWVVSPHSLQTFELPPRARIEEAARRWYDVLRVHPEQPGGRKAANEARQAADVLSAMLLQPAEKLLNGQPLLIVSDGALQYLPFAALPMPASLGGSKRAPLVTGHQIVSLPSASALAVLRRELAGRPQAPKMLAVLAAPVFRLRATPKAAALAPHRGLIGDTRVSDIDPRRLPRLTFSEREAEVIAGLVPQGEVFKGYDASRATVTSGKLAGYRMLHFATHGLIDSRRPELSSLVLSLFNERGEPQNGLLRLHDIYNLKLQADLVVLSACQTALGQEIRGEGLVGLTRGFMYAGAARVVASLWSVDDRATSVLMQRFYRHMISGGMSPAAALRQAQSEMSREARWQDPYYWAAFSLQGEWR